MAVGPYSWRERGNRDRLHQIIQGNYDLKLGAILQQAWSLAIRAIHPILPAAALVLLVSVVISAMLLPLFNVGGGELGDFTTGAEGFAALAEDPGFQRYSLAIQILMAPLLGGVVLMGIMRAQGETVKVLHVFSALQRAPALLGLTALMMAVQLLVTMVFGQLLWLASLINIGISIFTLASLPLLLTHKISVLNAIYYSALIVKQRVGVFAGLFLIAMIALMFGLLTSMIGFIIVIPFISLLYGVTYTHIFGLSKPQAPEVVERPNDWSA